MSGLDTNQRAAEIVRAAEQTAEEVERYVELRGEGTPASSVILAVLTDVLRLQAKTALMLAEMETDE